MVVRHMRQRFHCSFPPSALFMQIRERTSANPMTEKPPFYAGLRKRISVQIPPSPL